MCNKKRGFRPVDLLANYKLFFIRSTTTSTACETAFLASGFVAF